MINKLINKIFKILILRNPLDIIFGRIFYGNDSTLRKNIQGNLAIKRNTIDKSIKSVDEVEYFKKYGFTKINRVISLDEVEKLKKKFFNEISNIPELKKSLRYDFSSLNNPEFFKTFSEVKNIFNNEMYNILENYYHGHFKVTNVHIYRILKNENTNFSDTTSYGSTIAWHNDGSRTDSVKIFISLDKIDENSGPMEFITKHETKKLYRRNPFIFSKINLAKKIAVMNCKRKMTFYENDAYFINTNYCLHRAQSPKTSHRDLLVYYCQSSNKPFNFDWENVSTENIY